MNKFTIVIVFSLVFLAGCKPNGDMTSKFAKSFTESLSSTPKELTFDIETPYTFIINGQRTKVRGVDTCQDEVTNELFECIDLSKPFADVYWFLPAGKHIERWSFVKTKDGKYLSLNRPDGTLVIPAKEQ